MRILIEAHHPGDIHFWKYPIRALIKRGHEVRMVARDRDVMRNLIEAYPWISAEIPQRGSRNNKFPLLEMVARQWTVARAICSFNPHVVASLFGSYCQSARLLGRRNVIFTDSEFQHFNHRIAHPFAHEIHTPYCFYKDLGKKQSHYRGIHEMAFLAPSHFTPNRSILDIGLNLRAHEYIVIRLSAWNTLHDINESGIGRQINSFVDQYKDDYQIVICAEENALPTHLQAYAMQSPPARFHDLLAYARFVLTEGASTASEAACLGIPTVYINSTEPRGYLQMLEKDWGLVRNFENPEPGLASAKEWLSKIDDKVLARHQTKRQELFAAHDDVVAYVIEAVEAAWKK